MKFIEKLKLLKLCWNTFKKLIFYKSDEYRQSLVDTLDNLEDSSRIFSRIKKCDNTEELMSRIDWVDVPGKIVVVSNKPGTDEWKYDSNDKEYDIHFRNACKDVIRNELFNKIGMQEYEQNLQEFEPDLYNAFIELNYNISRAEYVEAELEYTKSINNPQMYGHKSQYFHKLWDICQQKKQIYEEQKRIYETTI